MREYPKNKLCGGNPGNRDQSSSVSPLDRATCGTSGRASRLYAISSRQEQENFPYVVTGMIKVFNFDVYALLDPGESLSFLNQYVANQFEILPEKLCEPFLFLF